MTRSRLPRRLRREPNSRLARARPLGWTWNWRYVLIGYLIPIAYCLAASLGIWIFGFGGFPNVDSVHQAAESLGLGGAPDWVVIAMFVVVQGTAGMVVGIGAAAGEEIGWRGWFPSWRRCCRLRDAGVDDGAGQ
jgi:membrane protease YdiL (CAAX protease family)